MADLKYYDVIMLPVVTEKSLKLLEDGRYSFFVHPDATKSQIKEAVEKMFEGNKVTRVNTMNYEGKPKRRGYTKGFTPRKKKAIVTLTADSKGIEFFQGM